jgi:membrane-associated phospholipid phosphatase
MTPLLIAAVMVVVSAPPALAQDQDGSEASLISEAALRTAVREAFKPQAFASPLQNAQPPAEPAHTGLAALAVETWGDFKSFPQRRSTWVILATGGALALAVHPADQSVAEHLSDSTAAGAFWAPGKYIGGVGMVVAPVAIYVLGRYVFKPSPGEPHTNKWTHLGFDLVRAQIVDEVLVQAIKFSVQRERPNGSNYSFPSGHAAATFAFASVLERHLGYRLAWPTMVLAGYVASSRLHDNVHYLSDVVFGAALGTAVGWTVVGRHGRSNYALVPAIGPDSVAINFVRTPNR